MVFCAVWFEGCQFRPWRYSVHLIKILHARTHARTCVSPIDMCNSLVSDSVFPVVQADCNFYGCFITASVRQIVCRWQLDTCDWCLSVGPWAEISFVISVFFKPHHMPPAAAFLRVYKLAVTALPFNRLLNSKLDVYMYVYVRILAM